MDGRGCSASLPANSREGGKKFTVQGQNFSVIPFTTTTAQPKPAAN